MTSIRIHRNGCEYGPYTVVDAQRYLNEKNLLPEDMAWTEGMAGWEKLEVVIARLSGTATAAPQVPPPTPTTGGQTDGKEQFQKMAGQAYDVSKKALEEAGKFGGKAVDEAGKLMEKAGPAGQKVRESIRGKEKVVGAGVAAVLIVIIAFLLMPGGPGSKDIRAALERDLGVFMAWTNAKIIDVNVMNCAKQPDSAAYRCQIEVEAEITNPMTGLKQKQKGIDTMNFIKGSDGWRMTR